MLARIPSRLLSEWMAFEAIDPFEDRRGDLRSAQIVTAIANVNRDPKKQKEPYRIEDFVLRFDEQGNKEEVDKGGRQTWQEQKARLMALMPPPQPSPVPRKAAEQGRGSID